VRAALAEGLATALLPAGLAALWLWLAPQGCDLRGDPATYRWTCLLPGLFLSVAPVLALALPVAVRVFPRLAPRTGAGAVGFVAAAGAATQIVLVGGYAFVLGPAYLGLFLREAVLIPQPFVAGATAATVFVAVRAFSGRLRPPPK
jgi:hypothetical protein